MNLSSKIFLLTAFFLVIMGATQGFAAEWYESMESSGINQSYSVSKHIVASESVSDRADVKQAITEIAESVNREAEQNAESSLSREQDASHPSEAKNSAEITQNLNVGMVAANGGNGGGVINSIAAGAEVV